MPGKPVKSQSDSEVEQARPQQKHQGKHSLLAALKLFSDGPLYMCLKIRCQCMQHALSSFANPTLISLKLRAGNLILNGGRQPPAVPRALLPVLIAAANVIGIIQMKVENNLCLSSELQFIK